VTTTQPHRPLRVGFIGTGRKMERPGPLGYAMAYQHAAAYRALPPGTAELVACADISPENGEAFREANGVARYYPTYQEMLEREQLDMVSICTWPHLHAQMVIDTAAAGVRAIHCEKPMADSWGAARRMVQTCEERGVQLTFNHQRRFGRPFAAARKLAHGGEIGELVRVEAACGDIYDWGTHYFDMLASFVKESPPQWVMAQIDYRTEKRVFGAHIENQAIVWWQYQSGVYGLMATGQGQRGIGCNNRLVGTRGTIEVGVLPSEQGGPAGPLLRIWRLGASGWEVVDCGDENLHGPNYIHRAIADAIDALQTGREPELSARRALNATELIFGAYESSRRRARVDFPLEIEDHPLAAMVESGELTPAPVAAP
jgi:UDP-N-acetylglucosamine 3-dehydrogenase